MSEQRLGSVRETYLPPPVARRLAPTIMFVGCLGMVGGLLAKTYGPIVIVLVLVASGLAFVLTGWNALRFRLQIDVHADGIVVIDRAGRDVILFADVDELWFELERRAGYRVKAHSLITALRLIDHDKTKHVIPLRVSGAGELVNLAIARCSMPLFHDAEAALRNGETLHFGPIDLDAKGVRGPGWSGRWDDEITLVRHQSGLITLFTLDGTTPWQTIELDSVPHPSLFAKLVTGCAKKSETDEADQ